MHPKKRETFVLSKEQTLVNLFRNNSLACMGDFKRAICIFLFMHAPFIFILLQYNLLQSNLWNIFNNNSLQDYFFCLFVKGSHNTIDMDFYGVRAGGSRKGSNEGGESMIIIKGINHAFLSFHD